jgi:UDPglucose 6-dehydrogenase
MSDSVAVIGAGYVGLTTAACLSALGHRVVCADIDKQKLDALRDRTAAIDEPGLFDLIVEGMSAGRLEFVHGAAAADVTILCVPTPLGFSGTADLSAVESVVAELGEALPEGAVVIIKSTVPVGTATTVAALLGRGDIAVVSNPEFLREGSAVRDFMNPDRIVIGSANASALARVTALYSGIVTPIMEMDCTSAELIKYATNCYLAVLLSYVNSIAQLCEATGADVAAVMAGMGSDHRIGDQFLRPGPGWGGSCLPKDTHALLNSATALGCELPIVSAAIETNTLQRELIVGKVRRAAGGQLAGTRIGILGLTFKAGTSDLRDSPALAIAHRLADEGADLAGYDPCVPNPVRGKTDRIRIAESPYQAALGAATLVLLTEWPRFRDLDWHRIAACLSGTVLIDARNLVDPAGPRCAGLSYLRLGERENVAPPTSDARERTKTY